MGIRGIVVDNRITNVLRKKIGTICAELKRTKKKSGGFGVKRLTDKWRYQTYSIKLFYHGLDNYIIEKENQDYEERNDREKNLWRMKLSSDRNLRKHREKLQVSQKDSKDSNVLNFHSLCDFVHGCHNDRIKFTVVGFCCCLLSE